MPSEHLEQVKEQLKDAETVFKRIANRKPNLSSIPDRIMYLKIFGLLHPFSGLRTREFMRDWVFEVVDNSKDAFHTQFNRRINMNSIQDRVVFFAIIDQMALQMVESE